MKKRDHSEGPIQGRYISFRGRELFVRRGNLDEALAVFCEQTGLKREEIDANWRLLRERPQFVPGYLPPGADSSAHEPAAPVSDLSALEIEE